MEKMIDLSRETERVVGRYMATLQEFKKKGRGLRKKGGGGTP